MMRSSRVWIIAVIAALVGLACGSNGEDSAADTSTDRTMEATARGGDRDSLDACGLLREALLTAGSISHETTVQLESGGSTHPYCEARWRRPDADQLEAEHQKNLEKWLERRMEATGRREPFDERMPSLRTENKVMLTIAGLDFRDEAAAMSALENVVGRLGEGEMAEAGGTELEFQPHYKEWIDGLGDGAAWSSSMSQISVAARGTLFHVSVRASDEVSGNRQMAAELSRAVIARLSSWAATASKK